MTARERVIDAMAREARRSPDSPRRLAERMLDAALATGDVVLARCSCPTGWGDVRDANCPSHGARQPAHTVTMVPQR